MKLSDRIKLRLWLLAISAFFALWAVAGCKSPAPQPVKASVKAGAVEIVQEGRAVEVPAKVEESKAVTTFEIPARSTVEISPASGALVLTMAAPSPAKVEHVQVKAEGPKPIPPPTPAEEAAADVVRKDADTLTKFLWAGGAMAVAALCAWWRGYPKAAGVLAAGAVAAPILKKFYSSDAAQTVLIVAGAAAVAFYLSWHFLKKSEPAPN